MRKRQAGHDIWDHHLGVGVFLMNINSLMEHQHKRSVCDHDESRQTQAQSIIMSEQSKSEQCPSQKNDQTAAILAASLTITAVASG